MISQNEINDNYMDLATVAKFLGVTRTRATKLCSEGRFPGAIKAGWVWLVPRNAVVNFRRLKRGVKPAHFQKTIDERKILLEALEQIKKQDSGEN